jgi:hypothetical protein
MEEEEEKCVISFPKVELKSDPLLTATASIN